MASPAPSNLSADGAQQPSKTQEQITFRFCRECSNMLYPKEDRMTNKLMFACRTCQFSEEALSSCVFRNNMYNTVGETAGVTQDVGSDPTVCAPGFVDSAVDFDPRVESDRVGLCCTLCGMEVVVEDEYEEEEEAGEHGKGADVMVFDLSGVGGADEEMDGEPDTTSDEQQVTTSPSSYTGEKCDAKEQYDDNDDDDDGERISHFTNPEHKTS